MANELVSILVPVYNNEKYMRRTLDCILSQTYKNWELIVTNDGSDDGTADILHEYVRKDSRIFVKHEKCGGGVSYARADAYKRARGDYILFLDHDDIFHPDMLKDMMLLAGEADMIYAHKENVMTENVDSYIWKRQDKKPAQINGRTLALAMFEGIDISGLWGCLIKKAFFESVIPELYALQPRQPALFMEDLCVGYRCWMKTDNIILMNKIYVLHRIYSDSLSFSHKPNSWNRSIADMELLNLELFKNCGWLDVRARALPHAYLAWLRSWYWAKCFETDRVIREKQIAESIRLYDEHYKELKRIKCKNMKEVVVMASIRLWKINKLLWKLVVGDIRWKWKKLHI